MTDNNRYRHFIFDLDGTLVDSIPDLTTSVNLLRAELDLGPVSEDQVRSYVGDGVGLLVQRALPRELFTPASRRRFVDIYTEHLTDATFIYPGILEFLDAHSGKPKAVVTNKPQHLAEALMEKLGLTGYFDYIIGAEVGLEKKPHPAMVNRAIELLGIAPVTAVMFGDHHVDLSAARAAGIASCFCGWGLGYDDGLDCEFRAATTQQLFDLFPGTLS